MNSNSKKAIIHCRISSTRQTDGESHETQEEASRFVANRYGAEVLRVWKEVYSGRKNERPVFEEILEYIDKSKVKIDYYIIRAIDRFTRVGAAEYEIMKKELTERDVKLIDSYGIIQPPQNTLEHLGFQYGWSMQSPSETTEVVMAQNSKAEVTNMLTRMIGQEIRLTKDGYKVRRPDDGFINRRVMVDGKKKMIQVPDPNRSHFYADMFKLRATGTYSDKEIVEKLNAKGFNSKKMNKWNSKKEIIGTVGGKPLTVKRLQAIIKRPIYAGVVCEKWTNHQPIKARYDGLVTIETFNKANRGKVFIREDKDETLQILYNHSLTGKVVQRRLRNNPLFPFKFLLCVHCRKPFLGSAPKGKSGQRFPTYHCARGHKYYGISKQEFDDNIKKFVEDLSFNPKFLNYLEVALLDKYRGKEKEITQNSAYTSKNIAELKSQKALALDSLITTRDPSIRDEIEKRITDLQQQIKNAEQERSRLDVTEQDIHDFIEYAKYLMEHLEELLINQESETSLEAQQALFGLVFDEIPTYQEILNRTPKLSLVFKLSSKETTKKDITVTLRGIEPRFQA